MRSWRLRAARTVVVARTRFHPHAILGLRLAPGLGLLFRRLARGFLGLQSGRHFGGGLGRHRGLLLCRLACLDFDFCLFGGNRGDLRFHLSTNADFLLGQHALGGVFRRLARVLGCAVERCAFFV